MLGLRKPKLSKKEKYNVLPSKPKSENIYKKWTILKIF